MRSTTESRPLKVLLLSLFHPELVRGGAQQVCYELFQGLKEVEGIEPTLLSAVDPSFKALYKAGARITGFDGRPGEFVFLGRDYDYWWHRSGSHLLVESYIEFLETLQPDVVHFHNVVRELSVAALLVPAPRVLTAHDMRLAGTVDPIVDVGGRIGSPCAIAVPNDSAARPIPQSAPRTWRGADRVETGPLDSTADN